jgi:ABC-type phosphate transport system substrate-binding protein
MNKEMKVFDQYFEYYIYQKDTKQLHKIKLKEKDILKEINTDQATKEKIKNGEINLSNEMHVISFIKTYNNTQS